MRINSTQMYYSNSNWHANSNHNEKFGKLGKIRGTAYEGKRGATAKMYPIRAGQYEIMSRKGGPERKK